MAATAFSSLFPFSLSPRSPASGRVGGSICVNLRDLRFLRGWAGGNSEFRIPTSEFHPAFNPSSLKPRSSTIAEMTDSGIPPDEIQIWWTSVPEDDSQIEALLRYLDDSERQRADRFRIADARRRFIGARAFLRLILGRATGVGAEDVTFSYGTYGKPRLATVGPCFNATDSGNVVAVALALDEIGIDVEVARHVKRLERLARRICTEREIDLLENMSNADRNTALLRLWTAKEAGLKAVGTGLSGGMKNVEVEFEPARPPRLRQLCGEFDGWTLSAVDLRPGLVCTIVVKGEGRRLIKRHRSLPLVGEEDLC
jgi:4'-phosphopantetheinyl transferase